MPEISLFLGFLPGGGESDAWGVSGDGNTVVGDAGSGAFGEGTAIRWTQATGMVPLFAGDSCRSRATGASGDVASSAIGSVTRSPSRRRWMFTRVAFA